MPGKLLSMVEDSSAFLSTIQVAITLAGYLGAAFAGENFAPVLSSWLYNDLGFQLIPLTALNSVAIIIITIILSYFTLVFGELVPKRIALQKSYEWAKWPAGSSGAWLLYCGRLSGCCLSRSTACCACCT